ncbi:MAG: response regulator [Gomphosphaeria aponina SAG 52.96 = DSM 107014]|uniref:histidine kinase n=1 Tax=Gomphosphaeria aponina SAG 52.96 = DSM 107014 TaxID=1521640 RepID=A0A941GRV5_9CHRO|nr:response regulator [Gomphosphaeria aponina SAG 52.96 = DSM 107014]
MTKILVIEDEPQVRSNIKDLLELAEFEPIVAEDGREGVKLAKENLPDLILCDIMMPNLDGYGVLHELKMETTTAKIPLIFLTANAEREEMRRGMELGADDYVTKPFTPRQLLGAINARLEKKAIAFQSMQLQLNALRNNIALSLPHEFRTPLNGIIPSCELLKQCSDSLSPEEIEEIADIILDSAQRLQRMAENYLLYAELELIAHNPEKIQDFNQKEKSCSPKMLVEYTGKKKAAEVGRKNDLDLELEDANAKIEESYFTTMINELIDNAFKFSRPGTPVKITTQLNEEGLNLCITDLGRGMSSSQLHQVGAYMQFERSKYEQQGSGFGLILAQKIVELHGGKFTIKSIVGQQTSIQIILPVNDND